MLESAEFDIDCPNCDKKITIQVNQVGTSITCPHCKTEIELQDKGLIDGIADVEEQIDNIFKNL